VELLAVTMGQDLVDQDSIRMEDLIIREHFMGEIMYMGDLAPLLQEQDQEQDQANLAHKEAIAIKVDKVMVVISMGWLSLDSGVSFHSPCYLWLISYGIECRKCIGK